MFRFSFATCSRVAPIVVLTAGIGSVCALAVESAAPFTKQEVKTLIETAKTPADHMKLASYYHYEADKLKSEAKDHEDMEADYNRDPSRHAVPKWPSLASHCKGLAGDYTKAAHDAEELAIMHEGMAKTAEK